MDDLIRVATLLECVQRNCPYEQGVLILRAVGASLSRL